MCTYLMDGDEIGQPLGLLGISSQCRDNILGLGDVEVFVIAKLWILPVLIIAQMRCQVA